MRLFGFGLAGFAVAGVALLGGRLDLVGAGRVGPFGGVGGALGFVLLVALVAFFAVVAALAAKLVAHFEGGENVADGVGEAGLVVDSAGQARQVVAGALLDPRAPQVDDLAA